MNANQVYQIYEEYAEPLISDKCAVNHVPDALIAHVAMDMAIKHEQQFGKSTGARAPPAHDALQNLSHFASGTPVPAMRQQVAVVSPRVAMIEGLEVPKRITDLTHLRPPETAPVPFEPAWCSRRLATSDVRARFAKRPARWEASDASRCRSIRTSIAAAVSLGPSAPSLGDCYDN